MGARHVPDSLSAGRNLVQRLRSQCGTQRLLTTVSRDRNRRTRSAAAFSLAGLSRRNDSVALHARRHRVGRVPRLFRTAPAQLHRLQLARAGKRGHFLRFVRNDLRSFRRLLKLKGSSDQWFFSTLRAAASHRRPSLSHRRKL